MSKWFVSTEKKTLDEAKKLRDDLNSHRVPRSPLRFVQVVVAGPNDGFVVCDLGFSMETGLAEIR